MLIAGVLLAVDPAGVWRALQKVPPGHVLAAFALVQLQVVLSALRWRFTAQRLGHSIPVWLAIREYYLGTVLNQTLPGGIIGDAARVYRVQQEEAGGWKRAATAVALERLSGQLAFFLLTCCGLVAWVTLLPEQLPLAAAELFWTVATLVGALAVGLALFAKPLWRRFGRFAPDLAAVFWERGAAVIQLGLSSLVVGTYVLTFVIASDAIGAPLPPIAAVTIIPLCLLTMLIPIGIGGWGTREAAAAALWPLFGFTGAEGLAASLLYGLLSLVGAALPGVVVLVLSIVRGAGRTS
ncbi:conserved hypothetical protein [Rhizobium sp. RU36D]|nr:conserved hypothetical protein [Rhizobium sp. RU36D]